ARRTGKDVNSHTVLDGIITTIMATIQRINIIGSREGSRNRRRLKANQTGKKFRVGIKRSEERFSRNAETDLVCRLPLHKKHPHTSHLLDPRNIQPHTLSLHDALPILPGVRGRTSIVTQSLTV